MRLMSSCSASRMIVFYGGCMMIRRGSQIICAEHLSRSAVFVMSLLSQTVVIELCRRPAVTSHQSTLCQTCHIKICQLVIVIAMWVLFIACVLSMVIKFQLQMINTSRGNNQLSISKFKIRRAIEIQKYIAEKNQQCT